MAGQPVAVDWNGRQIMAWLPDPVAQRAHDLSETTRRRTEHAATALVRVDASLPANWESYARILLRAEGIASSSVEGVTAPAAAVFAAVESDDTTDVVGDVGWVADNLAIVAGALAEPREPITHQLLHTWHAELMRHSRLPPEMIGSYRTSPGWIGGTSPASAAYVAPPAEHIDELMTDLLAYANSERDDPVTQAAIVHGQFETIHPYGDGNGRIGRVLIARVLARRCGLLHLPPPTSVLIARDAGGYISGLWQFREGSLDAWVGWFAGVVERAATATAETLTMLDAVRAEWDDATADLRADSAARAVLDHLIDTPVVTASIVAERLGVSTRAARSALAELGRRGVIEPTDLPAHTSTGRAPQWWTAGKVTDAISAWASGG